jgi:enoyl-CoA hydratase/carnithine racemase
MMSADVQLSYSAGLATVTLSHPGKFNAMSRHMWRLLRSAFETLAHQPEVRCVVVTGRDGNFCAGGDISEYADFRFQESSLRDFHENDVWGALQAMLDCEVPLVAAILTAAELKACGFLSRVMHDAQVGSELTATVQRIHALSPQAARLNKRTIRALQAQGLAAGDSDTSYLYANSAEHREGILAFLEKRRPVF